MQTTLQPLDKVYYTNASLEALKWCGLLSMTIDHTNKYLFNGTIPYLFEIGRLAFPIFVFVLCYKISLIEKNSDAAYKRIIIRLAIFGTISIIPLYLLSGNAAFRQLNVLFTLLTIVWVLWSLEYGTAFSNLFGCVVFIVMGSIVEYGWIGIGLGVSLYIYFRDKELINILLALFFLVALTDINNNLFALAVLPVIMILKNVPFEVPRYKWVFYVYYPAHLTALAVIRIPMSNSGYLFFT